MFNTVLDLAARGGDRQKRQTERQIYPKTVFVYSEEENIKNHYSEVFSLLLWTEARQVACELNCSIKIQPNLQTGMKEKHSLIRIYLSFCFCLTENYPSKVGQPMKYLD